MKPGEPRCRRQVLAFRVEFKGALVGSVARWPLGWIKKVYEWSSGVHLFAPLLDGPQGDRKTSRRRASHRAHMGAGVLLSQYMRSPVQTSQCLSACVVLKDWPFHEGGAPGATALRGGLPASGNWTRQFPVSTGYGPSH